MPGIVGIPQYGNSGRARDRLLEELDLLATLKDGDPIVSTSCGRFSHGACEFEAPASSFHWLGERPTPAAAFPHPETNQSSELRRAGWRRRRTPTARR